MEERKIGTREIQLIELDILKVFNAICRKHSIRYYLAYGTLLGAVRHQGFIPWDDDIDLLMPRPDYEKLTRLLREGVLPKGFSFGDLEDPSYIFPYLKIFKEQTRVVEKKHKPAFRTSPVWIDVFPMDGIPSSGISRRFTFSVTVALRKLLYTSIVDPKMVHGIEKLGTVILNPLTSLIGAHTIARWIDRFSRRKPFGQSVHSGNIAWGDGVFESVDTAAFTDPVSLNFEGEAFPAPRIYENHLKELFGDYMQLPPEDQRASHLGDDCFIIS